MPMLFALGQHQALVHAQVRLLGDEKLCPFLDGIYITSLPGSATKAHTIVEEELWTHAGIHLHHGKTTGKNRGGVEPENIAKLTRMARLWSCHNQQGLRVPGVPAHFASWADALSMVRQRHPLIAETMIRLCFQGCGRAESW